ncbi:hypothetical protein [Streptomyces sp. NPDC057253]|uniref:hypothetical protein n=1 Tax=Streptomyces sp. NPDC057253 TaxID=3346069 RepID=UPI003635B34A
MSRRCSVPWAGRGEGVVRDGLPEHDRPGPEFAARHGGQASATAAEVASAANIVRALKGGCREQRGPRVRGAPEVPPSPCFTAGPGAIAVTPHIRTDHTPKETP